MVVYFRLFFENLLGQTKETRKNPRFWLGTYRTCSRNNDGTLWHLVIGSEKNVKFTYEEREGVCVFACVCLCVCVYVTEWQVGLHPTIVLRPFVLHLFAIAPLANLHHFEVIHPRCVEPKLLNGKSTVVFWLYFCHLVITPLHNLRYLVLGLTPFGWLRSVTLTSYFWWEYQFLFASAFSGT
jgi:hypothetical protein